jgi:hypothetical protein
VPLSSTPAYRCPLCHADIVVTGYQELTVTLLTPPGEPVQRVIAADGEEVHRCPFVRARYEAVARERAQRLAASPSTLRIVPEPQLRLDWHRDG